MKNGLGVYDFKEEDELTEFTAGKYMEKFKNPSLDNPASLKYEYIECVSQGTVVQEKEIGDVPCVDVDAIDYDRGCDNIIPHAPLGTVGEDLVMKEENSGLDVTPQSNSTNCEHQPYFTNNESRSSFPELELRERCSGAPSHGESQLNYALFNSPSSKEPVDVISDAVGGINETSSSSPAYVIAEDHVSLNGHTSDDCFGDLEMDGINMEVVFHPDYVLYRGNYCLESLVIFSCTGIKVKGSTVCGNERTFSIERGINDIIDIECQWFQKAGLVILKLRILSKDAAEADNSHGTSGIEELRFAVVDSNWFEKQEEITSLNVKYLAVWDLVLVEDMEMDGDASSGQRRYFPSFDEPFEEIIYPKGDSDAVSISKRDVDLLQPETFINDTIIDFYIKYLENLIQPEEKTRFHFFNSFFFRKLADLDKDPSSISDGRAAFLRVHKWTRKLDIFGKDYIFIPVNFNLHWSLIVICHPDEVAHFKDEDPDKSLKVPCILHMDSIRGSHAGLKNLVQSYLWEEWKERHKVTSEEVSSKVLNLRFVSLELPQQENSFDCGLFLLHYLELFLAEPPINFNPFNITKFSNFLNVDWFPPAEVSLKRTLIQRLIFEELIRPREVTSAVCSDEHPSSKFSENNENEIGVEFLSERCSPAIACHGNLSNSPPDQGIEITLLAASSMRNLQSVTNSGLVLREFFEPGATAGSLLGQYQSFDEPSSYYHLNGAISTREEDAETGEQFVYLPSGENSFQQIAEITPQACEIPYSSRGFETEASWNPGISMEGEHAVDSSPEASFCATDDSGDVGIIENNPVREDVGLSHKVNTGRRKSPSAENIECLTEGHASASDEMLETSAIEGSQEVREDVGRSHKVNTGRRKSPSAENIECLAEGHASASDEMLETSAIEGSQDPDKMHDSSENGEAPSSQENPIVPLHEDPNMAENGLHLESEIVENKDATSDVRIIGDDLLAESDEQRATKRLRLTPPLEGGNELGGNLSKDLHL